MKTSCNHACAPSVAARSISFSPHAGGRRALSQPRQGVALRSVLPLYKRRAAPAAVPLQVMQLAVAVDEAPAWTLDQVAGLVFGGLLVAFYVSSKQVDVFVARAQRRQLGLCEQCGGVYDAAMCQQEECPEREKPAP